MSILRPVLFASLAFAAEASATAVHPCAYDVFSPAALEREVAHRFPLIDVDAFGSVEMSDQGVPNGRLIVLSGGNIVGQVERSEDVRAGRSVVQFFDVDEVLLFSVTQVRGLCAAGDAPGICDRIVIQSEQQPEVDGRPPFVVELGAADASPRYYRYGQRLGRAAWHDDVLDALHWLGGVYFAASGVEPVAASDVESLFWGWAAEPTLTPYLPRLTLTVDGPRMVVHGVVPSRYVYDRVSDVAHDRGFWDLAPALVIDTRTRVSRDLGPTLSTCRR